MLALATMIGNEESQSIQKPRVLSYFDSAKQTIETIAPRETEEDQMAGAVPLFPPKNHS